MNCCMVAWPENGWKAVWATAQRAFSVFHLSSASFHSPQSTEYLPLTPHPSPPLILHFTFYILHFTLPSPPHRRRCPRQVTGAFVLFEVLVAVVILATSLAAIMRGLTTAMKTIEYNRATTTAMSLAQRLLDEYEIEAPALGQANGEFGEAFPDFQWQRDVWIERVSYSDARAGAADNEFADLVMVRLRILHVESYEGARPLFETQTSLTQLERFSREARLRNGLYANENNSREGRRK